MSKFSVSSSPKHDMSLETGIAQINRNNYIESKEGVENDFQRLGNFNTKSNIEPDNILSSSRFLALKGERLLNAFASLLSSAQSFGLKEPLMPRPEPALACLLSTKVKFNRGNPYNMHTASFSSLSLRNSITDELKEQKQKLSMQEMAALNLAFPCFVDHSDAEMAPVTIIQNFTSSYMTLVKSRMRTSLGALFGDKSGLNSNEAMLLMKLLTCVSCSSPISLSTIVTSFRTLPMTEDVDDPSVLYLPLVYEAILDITVFGTLLTVKVSAPGTITGVINQEDGLLERVEVLFDTIALLQAMMKQARYVVRKAVARAAGIAYRMSSSSMKSLASRNILNKCFNVNPIMPQECSSGAMPDKTVSDPILTKPNPFLCNTSESNNNSIFPTHPSKNIKTESSGNEEYKMFSWLAGDEMLLDKDEQNIYTTNRTKHNLSTVSDGNDFSYTDLTEIDKPMKKRKVSFCRNRN